MTAPLTEEQLAKMVSDAAAYVADGSCVGLGEDLAGYIRLLSNEVRRLRDECGIADANWARLQEAVLGLPLDVSGTRDRHATQAEAIAAAAGPKFGKGVIEVLMREQDELAREVAEEVRGASESMLSYDDAQELAEAVVKRRRLRSFT